MKDELGELGFGDYPLCAQSSYPRLSLLPDARSSFDDLKSVISPCPRSLVPKVIVVVSRLSADLGIADPEKTATEPDHVRPRARYS